MMCSSCIDCLHLKRLALYWSVLSGVASARTLTTSLPTQPAHHDHPTKLSNRPLLPMPVLKALYRKTVCCPNSCRASKPHRKPSEGRPRIGFSWPRRKYRQKFQHRAVMISRLNDKPRAKRMYLTSPRQIVIAILLVLLMVGHAQSQRCTLVENASSVAGFDDTTGAGSLDSLRRDLDQIRSRFPGDMSIYMKNLSTADEIALGSDSVYETFSVIKLAIAAELMHQVESGKFSLSDRITTKTADERLPSGVLYALEPGLSPTVKDLLTLMIIISDNEATDLLADKVGRANVTEYMHSLGLTHTSIQFSDLDWDRAWLGTLDPSYRNASGDQTVNFPFGHYSDAQVQQAFDHTIYDAGVYFGRSTTREIGRLLEMIATGNLVSKDASNLVLGIMEKQQVNDRFPRYLEDVRIAHKTGDGQPFIANDAGIVWVKNQPIVLVVFTGHHRGGTEALHNDIARVAALVVKHHGGNVSSD